MRLGAGLPWLLFPAAVGWGLLAEREQVRAGRPWTFVVPDLVTGLTLVAAGLLVWWYRRDNRCWWLLVVAGFAWYIGTFQPSVNEDIALAAFAFGSWHGVFVVWAVLAFPTGRLPTPLDRLVLSLAIVVLGTRSLSRLLLFVPPDVAGYGTKNRFLPITDDRWWRAVEDAFEVGYPGVLMLVLVSLAGRWLRSSAPGRRTLSPALVAGSALAAAAAVEYWAGWNTAVLGIPIAYLRFWSLAATAAALAVGLIRLRRTRSSVIDLVGELGRDAPPARLGGALRGALGDPDLILLSWSAAAGGYVTERGEPAEAAPEHPHRAVTLIAHRGEPVAALIHDVALLEDPGLVSAVVAAVRLTIENERLRAELQSQLDEVAASRSRIVAAGDAERRRIERDLHDGAQQRLVTIALALRLAETRTGDATPRVRSVLAHAVEDLAAAIDELRDLARGIHPAVLTESGLVAALTSLADRSPVPVELRLALSSEPPNEIAAAAYFAAAEALTNVAKHSHAQQATVQAGLANGAIHIIVRDDGEGGADAGRGTGLRGIADRAAAVGGSLHIHSPPGGGTCVEVELPCALS